MALIRPLKGITPTIGDNCFLAETAALIGDVTMGNDCSIWYGAVLRGDVNPIRLGNRVNIQDCAVLHTLHEKSVVELGDNVSVGHNATVHGARVEHACRIGMGPPLPDTAVVHSGTITAAGALVLANQECDPGCVYAGVPAKKVKTLTPEERHRMITLNAEHYLTYSSWYTEPEE